MLKELTVSSLEGLFDFLNGQTDIIFWIRSADYRRQIYVSSSYESICQRPCSQLYEYPDCFNDYVVGNNREQVIQTIDKMVNKEPMEFDGVQMFQMITPKNQLVGFKQTTFALVSPTGEHIGFAGIGKYLLDEEWHEEFPQWSKGRDIPITNPLKKYIIDILKAEAKVEAVASSTLAPASSQGIAVSSVIRVWDNQGVEVALTKREQECLKHLAKGLSAKQTAHLLNISPRTVEFHLGNIKDKARCRTQVELLSKLLNSSG